MTVARCLIALSLATLPLSSRAEDVPAVTQTQGWQAAPTQQSLSFRTRVTLAQAMTTSRGERLEPGEYELDVIDSGDGKNARVVFYRGGVAVAETAGTARPGGSATMYCDERPPSSTGFQDLHRDPASAGITCSSRPAGKAEMLCNERPPSAKGDMLCNGRPPSSTGFQDVHREPGSAAILCSARPGAKAQLLCDGMRPPAKAQMFCDDRPPSKDAAIGCNTRAGAKAQMLCDDRPPTKDATIGFQCDGRAPTKAALGAAGAPLRISAGAGHPVIELTLVPAGH